MLLLLYIAVQLQCLSQAEHWAAAGPRAGPRLYPRISRMQRHGFGLAGGGRPDLNNGSAAFLRSTRIQYSTRISNRLSIGFAGYPSAQLPVIKYSSNKCHEAFPTQVKLFLGGVARCE